MKKICIIGLGNMGNAIFELFKKSANYDVWGCQKDDNINDKLQEADIFIIAVKPQNFSEMAEKIKIDLSEKMGVSIMAGVSIEKMQKVLKMKKVVRTLPNLPLKVGAAMTEWKCSEEISSEEKNVVKDILRLFGEEIEVMEEDDINYIGIMSGCGPALFAFVSEIIAQAGTIKGLAKEDANRIVLQTLIGTAKYLEKEKLSPEELRAKVTSKGGTTNAAVTYLQEKGFERILIEAIEKATARSKELNG